MHHDTEIQHLGEDRERFGGSVSPPVVRSSLFTFADCASLEEAFRGGGERPLYSRVSNPTVRVLESKIAALEGTDDARAFASGMGAISATLLAYLRRDSHVVCSAGAYAPTLALLGRLATDQGVRATYLPPAEVSRLGDALQPDTALVYLESPASLTFEVVDIEAAAKVARAAGVPVVVDNSWATPLGLRPVTLGADLALHSGTKYIAGHSDILLGLVAGRQHAVAKVAALAALLGASLSPADAFLAVRGLRTLPLRMRRHEASGLAIATRLDAHPRVKAVLHPGLPSFPGHELWRRQFDGASGLFSFRLRGDTRRFCDALELFSLGVSWGGFESLALPQAVLPRAERKRRPDVPQDLIRLSIGLEDPDDLWADLERGFAALE